MTQIRVPLAGLIIKKDRVLVPMEPQPVFTNGHYKWVSPDKRHIAIGFGTDAFIQSIVCYCLFAIGDEILGTEPWCTYLDDTSETYECLWRNKNATFHSGKLSKSTMPSDIVGAQHFPVIAPVGAEQADYVMEYESSFDGPAQVTRKKWYWTLPKAID